MGLLRLVLAISVAIGHSTPIGPVKGIEPSIAVEAFYIISGFYMSLVLAGKYGTARSAILLFYTNRYLRLAPTYWVLFMLALVGRLAFSRHHAVQFDVFAALPAFSRAWVAFTNISLLGLDSLLFFGVADPSNPHLSFSTFLGALRFDGANLIVLPPAWSLGVELTFYSLAPFIARLRSPWVIAIVVTSIALRCAGYSMGYNRDPWTYRFFPFEFAWFLVGMLAQRVYARRKNWIASSAPVVVTAFSTLALACLVIGAQPQLGVVFLCAVALCIPFIFSVTQRLKFDAVIAELSYPVYLVHFIFVPFVRAGLLVCLLSICAAVGLVVAVERPIAGYRQRRVQRFKSARDAQGAVATSG